MKKEDQVFYFIIFKEKRVKKEKIKSLNIKNEVEVEADLEITRKKSIDYETFIHILCLIYLKNQSLSKFL